MGEVINPVRERTTTVKCWDIDWSVTVTLWEDGQWTIFAEGGDRWRGVSQYDPLWEGDHDPTDEEISTLLEAQLEAEAESAWESRCEKFYSA